MEGKEQVRRCFFSLFLKVDTLTDLSMSGPESELKNKELWYWKEKGLKVDFQCWVIFAYVRHKFYAR